VRNAISVVQTFVLLVLSIVFGFGIIHPSSQQ